METHTRRWCRLSVITVWAIALLAACQSENISKTYTNAEKARLAGQTNTQMIVAAQEALDITAGALNEKGVSDGRVAGRTWQDDFSTCNPSVNLTMSIDRSRTDSLVYTGSISVSYGNGANCATDARRTGIVVNDFVISVSKKNKLAFRSTETITLTGFGNEVAEVDGSLVVKSANGRKTTVEARNATISYNDGTSATWNGKLDFAYDRAAKGSTRGDVKVTGTLTGFTRQGSNYTATILEGIVFKAGCLGKKNLLPVSGVLQVKTDAEVSTVNYGTGTCDRNYTVEVGGETSEHTIM